MSDNINVTPGIGKTVATEDLGGAQYQKVKIVGGQIGSTSVLGVNPDGSINVSVVGTVQISGSVAAVVVANPNQSVSGTVGASIIGLPNVNVVGSVAAFQTGVRITSLVSTIPSSVIVGASIFGALPAGNQVIGAVAASISGTVNVSGSIVAFQSGTQITSLVSTIPSSVIVGASIFGQLPAGNAVLGAVAASISGTVSVSQAGAWTTSVVGNVGQTGIIITSITGTPSISGTVNIGNNASVSGTVGASIIGTVPVTQGGGTWVTSVVGTVFVAGSIAAIGTPVANQSVSGTVGASIIGLPPVIVSDGAQTLDLYEENQSDASVVGIAIMWKSNLNTSILSAVTPATPLPVSVQGIIGISGNPSISGTVNIGTIPGSVVAFQGGAWTQSVVGTIFVAGSVATVGTAVANQSVSGTVGASIIGYPAVNVGGSVVAFQGAGWSGSVAALITNTNVNVSGSVVAVPTGNQSVSGTIGASVIGYPAVNIGGSIAGTYTEPAVVTSVTGLAVMFKTNISTSTMGVVSATNPLPVTFPATTNQSVSGTVGASIIGQLPAGTAVLGSVAVLQGTNPWTETFSNSSILAVPVGSVITVLQTSSIIAINAGSVVAIPSGSVITVLQSPSIVGTYAEDSASSSGDKGIFSLNVRNDTLSSVTSNDGDYGAMSLGPAGEGIFANAPFTKWVLGTASAIGGLPLTGVLVPIIPAQGASIFTYITGVQVANPSPNNVWITFKGANDSVVGFTVAPANGGSNIYYQNGLKTNANGAFSASISGTSSVYFSAQGFISKT